MAGLFENYRKSDVTNTRRVMNTPDEFARKNYFYLQEAGYLQSLKAHESRRQGLDSYLILVVLSGSGTVTYRQETYHVQAHDCVFIDCHNEYSHRSSEQEPWELMWIHFNGPHAAAYYHHFAEKSGTHFRTSEISTIIDCIEKILSINEKVSSDSAIISSLLITNILTLCITTSQEDDEDNSPLAQKLDSVVDYINEHYTQKITLDELSAHFYISKYYLARAFKKEFGMTIVQYILTKRITLAKELLRYSHSGIEEIAVSCGIEDASYFNKVFRKMENVTASEYRKKWAGR